MDQNMIMLIFIAVIIFSINNEMINLPYLMICIAAGIAGYTVIQDYHVSPHSCKEPLEIKPRYIGDDLKTDPSYQEYDEKPSYKNIEIHTESNKSKSYPTTHLTPAPLHQDYSITNYPFKLIDDKDGKVHPVYTQDDPSDEITEYAEDPDILEMYKSQSYNGDNMIADRMKYLSDKPKQAIIARSNLDKYTLAPFLEEELEQHANSRWWEDNQDLEHIF